MTKSQIEEIVPYLGPLTDKGVGISHNTISFQIDGRCYIEGSVHRVREIIADKLNQEQEVAACR